MKITTKITEDVYLFASERDLALGAAWAMVQRVGGNQPYVRVHRVDPPMLKALSDEQLAEAGLHRAPRDGYAFEQLIRAWKALHPESAHLAECDVPLFKVMADQIVVAHERRAQKARDDAAESVVSAVREVLAHGYSANYAAGTVFGRPSLHALAKDVDRLRREAIEAGQLRDQVTEQDVVALEELGNANLRAYHHERVAGDLERMLEDCCDAMIRHRDEGRGLLEFAQEHRDGIEYYARRKRERGEARPAMSASPGHCVDTAQRVSEIFDAAVVVLGIR